jgi:hypothetical protein
MPQPVVPQPVVPPRIVPPTPTVVPPVFPTGGFTPAPVAAVATTPAPVMVTAATPTTPAPIDLGVNTLNLPVLTLHGAEGTITDADLPLPKCHGDCNRNSDCDGNLLCFSRGGATTVPGCFGRADAAGTDYCWDPNDKPVPGVIAHVGNNGNPPQLFPLQRCTGQCASDADCAAGLICLFRDLDTDPVYGCTGPLVDQTDYCVDPADVPGGSGGGTVILTSNRDDRDHTLANPRGDSSGG